MLAACRLHIVSNGSSSIKNGFLGSQMGGGVYGDPSVLLLPHTQSDWLTPCLSPEETSPCICTQRPHISKHAPPYMRTFSPMCGHSVVLNVCTSSPLRGHAVLTHACTRNINSNNNNNIRDLSSRLRVHVHRACVLCPAAFRVFLWGPAHIAHFNSGYPCCSERRLWPCY